MTPAESSRQASLKRAARNCRALARILDGLVREPATTPSRMPRARVLVAEIGKDVHESNAYFNMTNL